MKIYKYIYYTFFLKSSKQNEEPEIPVCAMLSIIQTNNFLTIVNIFLFITKINIHYDIMKLVIICPISFYCINYYYFIKKDNGDIIIKDRSYSLGRSSFLLDLYNISSYFLVGLTYYLYKEF